VLRSRARWTSGWPITREECRGADGKTLLDHLAKLMPKRTPEQLNNTLHMLLRKTRPVIRPNFTNKAYNLRSLSAQTSNSKEVAYASNAIHNPMPAPP
jgi:hypothetical protein